MPEKTATERQCEVRFLDLTESQYIAHCLDEDAKWRALSRLGIKRVGSDTPLRAWIRAMCEENGLEVSFPAPTPILNTIVGPVQQWVWFLA